VSSADIRNAVNSAAYHDLENSARMASPDQQDLGAAALRLACASTIRLWANPSVERPRRPLHRPHFNPRHHRPKRSPFHPPNPTLGTIVYSLVYRRLNRDDALPTATHSGRDVTLGTSQLTLRPFIRSHAPSKHTRTETGSESRALRRSNRRANPLLTYAPFSAQPHAREESARARSPELLVRLPPQLPPAVNPIKSFSVHTCRTRAIRASADP
jgi:hypothetical protein